MRLRSERRRCSQQVAHDLCELRPASVSKEQTASAIFTSNNNNKQRLQEKEMIYLTNLVHFSQGKYDLFICWKVWVLAVALRLSSWQFSESKNKHIFWSTRAVFTCSLIQTFFYSHNKQLHTTLAQPVTVTHLCNNCLIANLTLSSSQPEPDFFFQKGKEKERKKRKSSHFYSQSSLVKNYIG